MSIEREDKINKVETVANENNDIAENKAPVIKPKYQVVSIEKIDTPAGMIGDHWHQYIIGQGGSKIEGLKEGSLKEVSLHAENFAEDLNNRSKGKMVNSVSRKKGAIPPTPPAPVITA
jgi:hypothetical protein